MNLFIMDIILRHLERGSATAAELRAATGLSQPTLSRALFALRQQVLPMGQARARRYALLQSIRDLPGEVPVYRVTAVGRAERLGHLSALAGGSFWFEATSGDPTASRLYPDLPWWLMDSRPQGFLGRNWPRGFPELQLPLDIRQWDSATTFYALARRGDYLWGDILLGEVAYGRWWEGYQRHHVIQPLGEFACIPEYERIADEVLQGVLPGSSPGGEQPKFAVRTANAHGEPVEAIVKFSPASREPIAQRWSDLLVAEHLALATLQAHGLPAATTALLQGAQRTFLQVERFDRAGAWGRKAVASFETVDAEFAGVGGTWPRIARALHQERRLPKADVATVEQLAAFGHLIGNSDMHLGNLSLFHRWPEGAYGQFALAPVYDMLPMRYAPVAGELRNPPPAVPAPIDGLTQAYAAVRPLAQSFWQNVQDDARISADFKRQAAAMNALLAQLRL